MNKQLQDKDKNKSIIPHVSLRYNIFFFSKFLNNHVLKKIKKGMRKQSGKKMHELFFEVLYQGWGGEKKSI